MTNDAAKLAVDPMMAELTDDEARSIVGGPMAVEYGWLASLIAAVCAAAILNAWWVRK